jgi:Zn-dependent protease
MLEVNTGIQIVIFIVILFTSVAFHEMMHAFVAYKLGDDLAHAHGRVSLNPLRHIDPMLTIVLPAVMILMSIPPILAAKPVPINVNRISGDELGLAAVGIAGPLTNLFLASIGAVILNVFINELGFAFDIILLFVRLNVALFVFNMLPLPPLDGSRLLYAVAPRPLQQFMEQIEQLGIFVTLMLLFLLLPFISPLLITANDFVLNILIR